MSRQDETVNDYRKLADVLKDCRVAMMQTFSAGPRDADAPPHHIRPMYTQRLDPELFRGELWFFTDAASQKVRDIGANDQILLTYADAGKNRFAAVWGSARCEHNEAKARELWNIHAKGWWPDGPESPGLTLIRVDVTLAEYWDGPSGATYMVKLAKAVATGERIKTYGEHGVVEGR